MPQPTLWLAYNWYSIFVYLWRALYNRSRQRHNELRTWKQSSWTWFVKTKLLNRYSKMLKESSWHEVERLDIHARGFWEPQRLAFFDVRVCHPNAESYRDLEPQQIHENEKKRQYSSRVLDKIRSWNIHPSDFYNNWWNGKRVLELPPLTTIVDCYQEKRGLRQNNLMDTSKNLFCTSEIRINLSQRN